VEKHLMTPQELEGLFQLGLLILIIYIFSYLRKK